MKKTFGIVLSVLFLVVMACFTLTACHEHEYTSEVVAPTCTTDGYTKHTCECGETYNDTTVTKLGHSFTTYTSNDDATCTEDGTKTATCDNGCGQTDTIADVGSAGHSFTNYVPNGDATCTEDGTKTATCDNGCGETDTIADAGSAGHAIASGDLDCSICNEIVNTSIFAPTNDLYKVELNTNADFVLEGDTSFKFSALQRWPRWNFSSEFVNWLADKNYDLVSFKMYFDAANGVAFTSGSWKIHSLAGTDCLTDQWVVAVVDVSAITADTLVIELNKAIDGQLDIYIDDIQFLNEGDFPGDEGVLDLAMFTLSGNAQIAINLNPDFIKEGSSSIRLHSPSRWPRYNFSQTFIDWLVANEYTTLSFDLYIDNAGSDADVTMVEQSGISGVTLTTDQWYSVSVNVADLSTSTWFQFNKDATYDLGVYLDNVQFAK